MKILIRSTSFLMQKTNYWNNLSQFKIDFGEYGNLFNLHQSKKEFNFEISVIFLQDIIDHYHNEPKEVLKEKHKINKILDLIKKKIKFQKNINHVFFISGYVYSNTINTLKYESSYEKIVNFFFKSLYEISKNCQNIYVVNLDSVFADQGLKNCFDNRNYSTLRCRLSIGGIKILTKKIKETIESLTTPRKKVLLLDCDNTLWGGVLSEDGMENIKLGQDGIGLAFIEFQKAIKKIKKTGVILVLLSKNNEKDVKNLFKNHKAMILKDKDITSYKVNWKEKSNNIIKISQELFLNINSFVFWDDNPVEREKVRRNFENIEVIEPDEEVSNWSKQLLEYKGFSKHFIVKEDIKKTDQYRSRNSFLDSKSNSKNEISFLKKLKIKPKLVKLNKSNLSRAAQLSAKTNQFNFNSKRLNQTYLSEAKKNSSCYLIRLKDDFGDHGYISLIYLKKGKNFLFVDQFLISCRILGRYVENWILNKVKKISKKQKIKNLIFEFIKTDNNQVAENFIKNNNFKILQKKSLDTRCQKEIYRLLSSKKSKLLILPLDSKIKHLEIYGHK